MRDMRLGGGLLICLGILVGCASGGTPTAYQAGVTVAPEPAETQTVSMENHSFVPETLTIPIGTTVKWVNNEAGVPHTATSETYIWDSGNLNTGQSYSQRFDQSGRYPYFCTLHRDQGMVGTIIVE